MIPSSISQSYDGLLKKCQRLVDVHGFHLRFSNRECFTESLGASQVHEVELGGDILRVRLDTRVWLDVDSEDTVGARGTFVQGMLSDDTISLTLK